MKKGTVKTIDCEMLEDVIEALKISGISKQGADISLDDLLSFFAQGNESFYKALRLVQRDDIVG